MIGSTPHILQYKGSHGAPVAAKRLRKMLPSTSDISLSYLCLCPSISLSERLYVYLRIWLCLCFILCPWLCLSMPLYVFLCLCLSLPLSLCPYVCLHFSHRCIAPSASMTVALLCVSLCLCLCISLSLCVYVSVCLCVLGALDRLRG